MKLGRTVKWAAIAVVALLCILIGTCAVMSLQRERNVARSRASLAEESLRREWVLNRYAPYLPTRTVLSEAKRAELSELYADIANAYERRDLEAMRTSIRLMPETNDHIAQDCGIGVRLYEIFKAEVMNPRPLPDFNSSSDFENYMRCNLELAWFYASLFGRRKDFKPQSAVESWVYSRLLRFREKFKSEKKVELEKSAERSIRELEAQIESPGGYTRRAIRNLILIDTEYSEALCPGRGLSRTNAIHLARAFAGMLVRAGYKPKWLDEEYPPLDGEKTDDQNGKNK